MGKLGKVVKLLKMMGYEVSEDIIDPAVQELTIGLRSTDGKLIETTVTRQAILGENYVVERIVKRINDQIKDAL